MAENGKMKGKKMDGNAILSTNKDAAAVIGRSERDPVTRNTKLIAFVFIDRLHRLPRPGDIDEQRRMSGTGMVEGEA